MDNLNGIVTSGRGNKSNEIKNEFTKMEVKCKYATCGALMEIETPKSVYYPYYGGSGSVRARCEECSVHFGDDEYMFHCPKGTTSDHKDGSIVCFYCAAKRKKTTTETKNQMDASRKRTISTLPGTKSVTSGDSIDENKNNNDNNENDGSILYNNLYLMIQN